jgi:hypothetical protein
MPHAGLPRFSLKPYSGTLLQWRRYQAPKSKLACDEETRGMGRGRSFELTIFVPTPGSSRACPDGAAIVATANPRAINLMVNRLLRCISTPSLVFPAMTRPYGGRAFLSFAAATAGESNS